MPAKKASVTPKGKRDPADKSLGRSSKNFKGRSEYEHIYKAPDIVAGSAKRRPKEEYIFDFETNKFKKVTMDLPDAVKRVFLEIVTNAGDAAYFSLLHGVDPGPIIFEVSDDGYLAISNGGLPVPVEPHEMTTESELHLVPTKTFGEIRQGSSYDETMERMGCGRNGYGSKLTNIFSKHFIVEIGDIGRKDSDGNPISGQHFIGEWKGNMLDLVRAEATPGYVKEKQLEQSDNDFGWRRKTTGAYKGKPFVKVEWLLDFKRFGMVDDSGVTGYTEDDIGLFTRYVIETSLTCQVPVEINGKRFDYRNIREFAKLIWEPETVKSAVSQFCWPKGVNPPKEFEDAKPAKREAIATRLDVLTGIEMQILLLDTPDKAKFFTYANGMNTFEGGVHVDEVAKKLYPKIIKEIGAPSTKKSKEDKEVEGKGKGKSGTKAKAKDKEEKPPASRPHLVPSDLKPHISMIVVCRVPNPEYDSQSKKKLDDPTPFVQFDDHVFETLISTKKWLLMERLMNQLDSKILKSISKINGKKTRMIDVDKGEDANDAGTSKSRDCSLYIVEGESATGYPIERIDHMPGGKDIYGYFPLKGKPMNVSANPALKIAENEEFIDLYQYLGLNNEMDYSTQKGRDTLRYGRVIIVCDADVDGAHILCLVLNFFHRMFPDLLKNDFVQVLLTPLIKIESTVKTIPGKIFFDERAFDTWRETPEGKTFKGKKPDYLKGLGSFGEDEIVEDIDKTPIYICKYDPDAADAIEESFNPKLADKRKLKIENWRKISASAPIFNPRKMLVSRPVSDVINYTLTPYMIDNLFRSIPSFKDGLKKAQRQALYYSLHHWKYSNSSNKEKTAKLGTDAVGYTKYHHGERSMHVTMIHMAQGFIGTNNLEYYSRAKGLFGDRSKGGKNFADPRYTSLLPAWWLSHVFQKDMVDLVPRRQVEGEDAEPNWLPCDIPLGIINGTRGLATGWSTNIPGHHPIDVVDRLIDVLEETKTSTTQLTPLTPYFNGFRGLVEIRTAKTKKEEEELDDLEAETKDFDQDHEEYVDEDYTRADKEATDHAIDAVLQTSERTRGRSLVTTGNFEIIEENSDNTVDVRVTEIPVGRYQVEYRTWAKKLIKKGIIRDIRVNSNKNYPDVKMYGVPKDMANAKGLGLIRSYGMSNMVMIDDDGIPKPYKSVEHIFEKYVESMLDMYEKLKTHQLAEFMKDIKRSEEELAIVEAVIEKNIHIIDVDEDELYEKMRKLKLNTETYEKMPLNSINRTKKTQLLKKIDKLHNDYDKLVDVPSHYPWIDRLIKFRKLLVKTYSEPIAPSKAETAVVDGQRMYRNVSLEYS